MSSIVLLKDRFQGMIWGQFIGDAAALGSQWIYDLKKLKSLYPQGIQGFESPLANHYHQDKKSGELTHYGTAALELLRSLTACNGFSATDFGTRFVETFASPDYHGYLDRVTKETIRNYHDFLDHVHPDLPYDFQEGANSDEISTATRLAPLLALYWDDTDLYSIVEKATKVTQNNEWTITYMKFHARIVHKLMQGHPFNEVVEQEAHPVPHDSPIAAHIRQRISQAIDMVPLTTTEATLQFGQECHLMQSFPASIQCALKHQHSFPDAITATLNAGGDNAGRAALIGTWLGAYLGINSIPHEWLLHLHDHKEISHLIESLAAIKAPIH